MRADQDVARVQAIRDALRAFETGSLRDRAEALLQVLGYRSERRDEDFDFEPGDFVHWADEEADGRRIAEQAREAIRETWNRIEMVFQYTGDELGRQVDLFPGEDGPRRWDKSRAKSFLFVAVDLKDGDHPRHRLADMTRAVNRPLKMPAIIIFRYCHGDGSTALTLAVIDRRDRWGGFVPAAEVLEPVTLIKDIRAANPHRAHVDVLAALALSSLTLERHTFDELRAAWNTALSTEALNKRFYRELFRWFERAVAEARFPKDSPAKEQVIRLIARMLFVWFVKQKGLVAEDWFDESAMRSLLHDFGGSDYYRAVLQNLFFATLNTPMDQRGFDTRPHDARRVFSRYRYRMLLRDIDRFGVLMQRTPFINCGLFDCLDDERSPSAGGRRIDMFSDPDPQESPKAAEAHRDAWEALNVPDALFFGGGGLLPLLESYKFTVEENTPVEIEFALNPELLGMVFEQLLAAYNSETRDTAPRPTGSYHDSPPLVAQMVDEALVIALADRVQPEDGNADVWPERLGYLLDYGLDYERDYENAEPLGLRDREAEEVVRVIAGLKVLDPAVGSGMFSITVLNKLTLALRRLDPANDLWRKLQMEAAVQRSGDACEDPHHAPYDEELREIGRIFDRHSGDFGRKLYLIQNNMCGSDIQTIACQIAKSRFSISLAMEQEADPAADNFDIEPLPNLETRFVAADWFDPEYVFDVKGGFDVVIGNPGDRYKSAGYRTDARTGDVYQFSVEKGGTLLRPNGVLTYVTSNIRILGLTDPVRVSHMRLRSGRLRTVSEGWFHNGSRSGG